MPETVASPEALKRFFPRINAGAIPNLQSKSRIDSALLSRKGGAAILTTALGARLGERFLSAWPSIAQ
jgi:hypothetical protein